MKVLYLHAGNLFGGVETFLITLAQHRQLCPQMQPHYGLCFEGRLATELRSARVEVYMLGEVRISRPWTVWRARRYLADLLQQESFNVVITQSCWSQAIFGPIVKAANLPLVFWCHDIPKGTHWLEQWAKHIPPDLVIANSQYTCAAVPKLYPQSPAKTLYLPVASFKIPDQAAVRRTVRAALNTPEDMLVIIQACRMESWKGHQVLLAALGHLQDLPGWICWIVGGVQRPHEKRYLQELQQQASQLGIAHRVKFLGQRNDVPQLLMAADIHCQPNTSPEPFGIAFIEALYAGLPVVTTAIGASTEVIDSSCGQWVSADHPDELAASLQMLMINPEERLRLSRGGPARARLLCDPSQQLSQLQQLLSLPEIQKLPV